MNFTSFHDALKMQFIRTPFILMILNQYFVCSWREVQAGRGLFEFHGHSCVALVSEFPVSNSVLFPDVMIRHFLFLSLVLILWNSGFCLNMRVKLAACLLGGSVGNERFIC
jgi:hypothetical protein